MRRKKTMHFSHHHPLRESNVLEKDGIVCSGCELGLLGSAYKCNDRSCNFILHKACFELPEECEHKSHPEHPLSLLSSPANDSYSFTCSACGDYGSAFNYYCSTCNYGFHVKCGSLPETVSREDHQHPITLCYSVPYDDEETELVCDVCDGTIRDDCWVYCCSDCDFGTHLDCATTKAEEVAAAEEEEEEGEAEGEKEVEEGVEEESGAKDPMASMHALLAAQIESQGHMQRMQFQMNASRQQAQFMNSISRSMANLL